MIRAEFKLIIYSERDDVIDLAVIRASHGGLANGDQANIVVVEVSRELERD